MFGQNVDEHNPAPSPSGHPLLSGPPTLNDIHQIFTPPPSYIVMNLPISSFTFIHGAREHELISSFMNQLMFTSN